VYVLITFLCVSIVRSSLLLPCRACHQDYSPCLFYCTLLFSILPLQRIVPPPSYIYISDHRSNVHEFFVTTTTTYTHTNTYKCLRKPLLLFTWTLQRNAPSRIVQQSFNQTTTDQTTTYCKCIVVIVVLVSSSVGVVPRSSWSFSFFPL
jgi:hypothetical protein